MKLVVQVLRNLNNNNSVTTKHPAQRYDKYCPQRATTRIRAGIEVNACVYITIFSELVTLTLPFSDPTMASDSETTYDAILPDLGAYAAFTIDPIASLSAEAQEIPETIGACKQLVNQQYVGLMEKVCPSRYVAIGPNPNIFSL